MSAVTQSLASQSIVTRFAPSPTGYLHVGGARTALYCWLHARQHQGQFILRVEDTDRERSTDEAVQAILDGMAWLGLSCDTGPVFQTHRFDRYREVIQQLLDEGKAYRCYCSKERLEQLREDQIAHKQKPKYDGRCDGLNHEDTSLPHVVRFRNPKEGHVVWNDVVKGTIRIANEELDDLIIARTDGSPTYNFTVVVDDYDMQVTQVIRGDDHMNNTPRQINLFKALNQTPPEYAHVPMILGDDGKKLSKRHGAVSVMQYRDDGYLPQALLNYLVRLGWSHQDQEIFSLDDMLKHFSIANINKSASAFNSSKLDWLNQHYMKHLPVEQVAEALNWHMTEQLEINIGQGPQLSELIPLVVERVKTLKEMAQSLSYFYQDFTDYDATAAKKHLRPVAKMALETVSRLLENTNDWHPDNIQQVLENSAEALSVGFGKIGMPLRVAVTGGGQSPDLNRTLFFIGKQRTLQRIQKALAFIQAREAG